MGVALCDKNSWLQPGVFDKPNADELACMLRRENDGQRRNQQINVSTLKIEKSEKDILLSVATDDGGCPMLGTDAWRESNRGVA